MQTYLNSLQANGCSLRKLISFLLAFIALIASFCELPLPVDAGWLTIAICGVPIIWEVFHAVITKRDIKADFLVSLALLASIYIGEIFAAAEIAFIMQLGAFLEEVTVSRAQSDIQKLISLTPQTARRLFNGEEHYIPAEQVHVDDIVKVLPGETVPVDGIIIQGQTAINQAAITGEALPVDKAVGDNVFSGTINQLGVFTLRASKSGANSSMQRMVQLVKNADADKAKIVGLADKWATWIVIMALITAFGTWIFTGESLRAVTVLVVFCPCALVLATPTAIMAAIGNATRHGFLVRQGDALERLASITQCVFDKTGTLTFGRLQVVAVKSWQKAYTPQELYALAAAAEAQSEHPLGKAITSCYKKQHQALAAVDSFSVLPGKGVQATVDNKELLLGNIKLLREAGIILPPQLEQDTNSYLKQGATIIYIAQSGKPLGFIALADTIRPQSTAMLTALKEQGLATTMLTGDNAHAAQSAGASLATDNILADCLPEDKLAYIKTQQAKKQRICMLGDGINDAPSLKYAHVGIAMGGIGSDIAIDAADIVLVKDKIEELPHLVSLSRQMLKTIKYNIIFSLTLNAAAIGLAVSGWLGPVAGALIHNGGSLAVIASSALLLNWQAHRLPVAPKATAAKAVCNN